MKIVDEILHDDELVLGAFVALAGLPWPSHGLHWPSRPSDFHVGFSHVLREHW